MRLIGIDTPETKRPGVAVECGGKQATAKMLRLTFTIRPSDTDGDGLADRRGGTGRAVGAHDTTQDTYHRYGCLLVK